MSTGKLRGRPRKSGSGDRMDVRLTIRLTREDWALIRASAAGSTMKPADWARMVLLRAARAQGQLVTAGVSHGSLKE